MRQCGKRLLSLAMALVMVLMLVPATAWASLSDLLTRDAAYNSEILSALEQFAGNPEDAQAYYEILQRYNLLDEDGSTVENWEITMSGEPITLDELREVLSGDYDPQQYVWVDGSPVTLENIAIILQIEDYITYLRETYFSDTEWTDEQINSLASLLEQLETTGVQVYYAGPDLVGGSGYNHAATVDVAVDTEARQDNGDGTVTDTFTVTLDGAAEGQTASFRWEAQAGTQPLAAQSETNPLSGDVTLTVGANGEASGAFTVTYQTAIVDADTADADDLLSTAALMYFVQLTDLTGALFEDSSRTAATVTVTGQANTISEDDAYFWQVDAPTMSWYAYTQTNTDGTWSQTFDFSEVQKVLNGFRWGIFDGVKMSVNGISRNIGIAFDDPSCAGMYLPVENSDGDGYADYIVNVADPDDWWYLEDTESGGGGGYLYSVNYAYSSIQYGENGSIAESEAGLPSVGELFTASSDAATMRLGDGLNRDDWFSLSLTQEEIDEILLNESATFSGEIYRISSHTIFDMIYYPDEEQIYVSSTDNVAPIHSFLTKTQDTETIYLANTVGPRVTSVTVPAGTYTPGQTVPILVTLSEPVYIPATGALAVNSGTAGVAAGSSGWSNQLVFLYTVQSGDTGLTLGSGSVRASFNNENTTIDLAGYNSEIAQSVTIQSNPVDTITDVQLNSSSDNTAALLVGLRSDQTWLSMNSLRDDGTTYATYTDNDTDIPDGAVTFYVSPDGGETQYPLSIDQDDLTGSADTRTWSVEGITAPTLSTEDQEFVLEVYIGGQLVMGQVEEWTAEGVVLWEEDDISIGLAVLDTTTSGSYDYAGNGYLIFPEAVETTVSYSSQRGSDKGAPTFGSDLYNATFTTFAIGEDGNYERDEDGFKVPVDPDADFAWWIGSATDGTAVNQVATIDAEGSITFTGAPGEVEVFLTALNGNVPITMEETAASSDPDAGDTGGTATTTTKKRFVDYQATYTYDVLNNLSTATLRVGVGRIPVLSAASGDVYATAGQDLTVNWTSNLTAKNAENGVDATPFTVTLYQGTETNEEKRVSVPEGVSFENPLTRSSTEASTVSSVVIPGELLTYVYNSGDGGNTYTLQISAPLLQRERGFHRYPLLRHRHHPSRVPARLGDADRLRQLLHHRYGGQRQHRLGD